MRLPLAITSLLVIATVAGCAVTSRPPSGGGGPITQAPRPVPVDPVPDAAPAPQPRQGLPPALSFSPQVVDVGPNRFTYASPPPAPMRTLEVQAVQPLDRHTVAQGETLFTIARTRLGDGNRWPDIVAANPGLEPSQLAVGQQLRLPR